MTELKQCPHCGLKVEIIECEGADEFWIECSGCRNTSVTYCSDVECIKHWNNRPLEKLLQCCGNCIHWKTIQGNSMHDSSYKECRCPALTRLSWKERYTIKTEFPRYCKHWAFKPLDDMGLVQEHCIKK